MILKEPIKVSDHLIGKFGAPVSLVLYGDYECTLTARSWSWIKDVIQEFDQHVVFAFRHYPLTFIHPHSALAAVAAEVAASYGRFWDMHEKLFQNHHDLSVIKMLKMAEEIGLNRETFLAKLEGAELMDKIVQDIMAAEESNVDGTPTWFMNGTRISGIVNAETLRNDIRHYLHEPQLHS